ncbi:hypothetical protein [Escherichia coli]|uniref:hypothetical protein n=1 Tax=Escherichia coli TaxID=562 RepID=UPI001EF7A077|nr:hypothetical protein [Escherichia coli]MCQ6909704.1 hypothetical protein [Escherichia coli]
MNQELNLFHATTMSRGLQITEEGKLRNDAPPVIRWPLETTPGWIYLSDRIDNAVHWGNKVAWREGTFFYIFRIKISTAHCYPDTDDLQYVSWLSPEEAETVDLYTCLSLCHSCRTNKELYIGREVTHYTILPVATYINSEHPQYDIVNTLKLHIGKDEYSKYESLRQRIEWISF